MTCAFRRQENVLRSYLSLLGEQVEYRLAGVRVVRVDELVRVPRQAVDIVSELAVAWKESEEKKEPLIKCFSCVRTEVNLTYLHICVSDQKACSEGRFIRSFSLFFGGGIILLSHSQSGRILQIVVSSSDLPCLPNQLSAAAKRPRTLRRQCPKKSWRRKRPSFMQLSWLLSPFGGCWHCRASEEGGEEE